MKLFRLIGIALLAFFVLTAESCQNDQSDSDKQQQQQQAQASAASNQAVGFPAILNFTEKRIFKEILEKRDTPNFTTYTYFVGMHNEHTPLCRSVGYGIPESEQYTNPEYIAYASTQVGVDNLPQADPNGLYSSPSANGTWIMCLFKDGNVLPVRSEPNVVTLPQPWASLNQDGM
ncbi:hypothetical protein [Paraburkholderia sp. BCC1886]|uniref:hypothetical protein n=1 Tax=Paraburkholderia sp. BCC1886 TaxID=2562670 RepID=UPI001183A55E|nr:hypothetical protein [Paraburkholderia sp. BCC1886]